MSYIGLYCRATVLSSEWSSENGRFRRHNYRCTVFLWQQCISSWIPVTRSSAWGRRFQTSQFFMHSWAYSVYPRPLLWRALLWWGSEAVLLCYSVCICTLLWWVCNTVHLCLRCISLWINVMRMWDCAMCICAYSVSYRKRRTQWQADIERQKQIDRAKQTNTDKGEKRVMQQIGKGLIW